MCSCCLAFGGDREQAPRPALPSGPEFQTLVSWKMERSEFLHRCCQQVPICHLVSSTLDPDRWLLGKRPFCSGPAATLAWPRPPFLEGWPGKEQTELTPLEPQNVFSADFLEGISYCKRLYFVFWIFFFFCQPLFNSPARFCMMLNYYVD